MALCLFAYLTIRYNAELGKVSSDFWSMDMGPVMVEFGFREGGIAVAEDGELDVVLLLLLSLFC